MTDRVIHVEVAYARVDQQWALELELELGATAVAAIMASGILERCPEIDLDKAAIGVFGEIADGTRVLEDGDRVEIYRPLKADPKDVRRELAKQGRSMGRGTKGRA